MSDHVTLKGSFLGNWVEVEVYSPSSFQVRGFLVAFAGLRQWLEQWRSCFVYRKGRVYLRRREEV